MRNPIFSILCCIFLVLSSNAQTVKVVGQAGMVYNWTAKFYGDCFTVWKNDGYAVVDLNGKVLTTGIKPPIVGMQRSLSIDHHVFFADNAGDEVLKNIHGQVLASGKYSEIRHFATDNTVARVRTPPLNFVVAYLDTTGKEIARLDVKKFLTGSGIAFAALDNYMPFSEGLSVVRAGNGYGFMNKSLQLVIPGRYQEATPFSDGLAAVKNQDGNWGFINKTGAQVIPFDYSMRPSRFMSNRARVKNHQGRVGFINKQNEVVIQPEYAVATCFYKGFALARKEYNAPIALIDTTGKIVATFPSNLLYLDDSKIAHGMTGGDEADRPFYIPETLQQLVDDGEGIFQQGMDYGVYDNTGKKVLDCKYIYLADLQAGKMFGQLSEFVNNSMHNTTGILDDKGNWVVQIVDTGF